MARLVSGSFGDLPKFEWPDLNGKTLEIRVDEGEGVTLVSGYCIKNDKIYLLHEDNKTIKKDGN